MVILLNEITTVYFKVVSTKGMYHRYEISLP